MRIFLYILFFWCNQAFCQIHPIYNIKDSVRLAFHKYCIQNSGKANFDVLESSVEDCKLVLNWYKPKGLEFPSPGFDLYFFENTDWKKTCNGQRQMTISSHGTIPSLKGLVAYSADQKRVIYINGTFHEDDISGFFDLKSSNQIKLFFQLVHFNEVDQIEVILRLFSLVIVRATTTNGQRSAYWVNLNSEKPRLNL